MTLSNAHTHPWTQDDTHNAHTSSDSRLPSVMHTHILGLKMTLSNAHTHPRTQDDPQQCTHTSSDSR